MTNIISPTGFWLEFDECEHKFIDQLSEEINHYINYNKIKTVYDFGCGKGDYLQKIASAYPDIVAIGFEGYIGNTNYDNVIELDLSTPVELDKADLVISIEVGEHIPKEFEQIFLDNVSNSAKNHIIISWAIEGQIGNGHVNCQNNDYVISELEKRGWTFNSEKTQSIRNLMPEIWIKNTVMVFNK